MRTLLKRSTSGLIYALLFIGAILYSKETYIILISVFGMVCLWEFLKLLSLKNIGPYIFFSSLVFLLFSSHKIPMLKQVLLIISLSTSIQLLFYLFLKKKKYPSSFFEKLDLSIRYTVLSFIFLMLIPFENGEYQKSIVLLMVFLVWTNDSFAYLIGKNFGKKKLFESVSPKKTVEGFIAGVFFTIIVCVIASNHFDILSTKQAVIFALIVSIFGSLGDLVESKFKRQANTKDSGSIMPGHGGLLDRLDSLMFIAPFVYLYIHYLI